MVDVIIDVAAKVAELLVVPIGKHIIYPFKYKSNMEELTKQVEKLTDQRVMVQHVVDEAKRQGDEIEKKVEKWMHSVDEFTNGVVKPIIDDQVKAGKLCSIGFCPNLMARYSLSRKAAKTTEKGVNLLGEGNFDKVAYRPPLQKTTSIYNRGYEDFDSRTPVFNDLMETLRKADVNLIGVCGMGGVGKTTLVKRVIAKAIQDKLFDDVVMAEVTETPDIKNIQGQIADKLGLTFREESLQGRADRLRDRLKKEKRLLLVLDNIWAKLDLEKIGIPPGEEEEKRSSLQADQKGRKDEQRRGKILFTSRNLHVLRDMNVEKNFFINTLSDDEAGDLFWKTAGDSAKQSDFDTIGIEIVRFCSGLPVAIATIASALKKKSLFDWKDALNCLRSSNPRNIRGMDANVYSAIKLSYNFLESEEAKSLFLLCSLHNASYNIHIEYLLRIAMGLRLFQDVSTLEQGRSRLYTLINNLKASSLLLDGSTNKTVKMHDIIHVVATSIASTYESMFNIQNTTGLKEILEEELSKDATAVSLFERDICELPERLELPKLNLLILFKKDLKLFQISDTFFEGVKELKFLDLTKFHLLSLPSSLQLLTKLQTLCLNDCIIGDIATIGALTKLEVLTISNIDIEHLPGEIRQLTRLRLLDIGNCPKLKTITPGVISSLTWLEELYMGDSFVQWDVNRRINAGLSELEQLSRLTTLEIHVLDAQIMPQDLLIFEKLERYRIIIGDACNWSDDYESSRRLKLELINSVVLGNGVKMLLNRTEDLYLDKLKGVKNVLYELNGEGFPQLKHLHVQNSHEIQCIVNSIQRGLCNVFLRLESLFLHNLINLEKICHGQLTTGSLSKLRILKIGECDRLTHLFSFSMTGNLLQLEEIEVTDCKKLEEIVFNNSDEQFLQYGRVNRTEFTPLRTLRLQCLPQLTSFGLNAFTPEIGSQEILAEDELGGFMPSFSQNVLLPNLENLKLSSINIECLWLDQLPAMSSCCQTLTSLILEECSGNLKFLFSYTMVKSLVLLEKLEIRNCKSIEGVINSEELRGEGKVIKMVFPKLINLQFKGLPKLSRFGFGNSIEFLSLTQISIQDCPKLKTFLSDIKKSKEVEEINFQDDIHLLFDEKVVLPNLASMNLSSIRIKTIWHNQVQPMSSCFQNLKEIHVNGCDTLKHVFSSSMVESLIQLEVLEISNCTAVEVVTITAGERLSSSWFPRLYCLVLEDLPELTTFCNFAGKSIELISLSELWLQNCPKVLALVSNSQHADMPAAKEEQKNSEKNLQYSHIQPFFDEKIVLPSLKNLKLSSINIRCTKLDQLPVISSCSQALTNLTLEECNDLKFLFSYSVVQSLVQLQKLEVRHCKSIEEIINIEELRGEKKMIKMVFPKLLNLQLKGLPKLSRFSSGNSVEFLSLTQISIEDCPKLKTFFFGSKYADKKKSKEVEEMNFQDDIHLLFDEKVELPTLTSLNLSTIASQTIWHNQLQPHSACFHHLTALTIFGCHNLKYLFPISVAESLNHLEVLAISNCMLMEGVMITQGERKSSTLFPKLKGLILHFLPELTRFCNFNGNSIEEPEEVNTETYENRHSFFDEKVGFPSLEKMVISGMDNLESIWHNQFLGDSFYKLKSVEVNDCQELKTIFPSCICERLLWLESLTVKSCGSVIEIFDLRGINLKEKHSIQTTQLRELYVDHMSNLKHIWNKDPKGMFSYGKLQKVTVFLCPNLENLFPASVAETLLNLDSLEVSDCGVKEIILKGGRVKQLVPYFVSFQNLTTLEVLKFNRLVNLMVVSVAKSLVQLTRLKITECKMIEEIITTHDQVVEKKDRIIFNQLKYLELYCLPRLASFCSGNYTIECPSLQHVVVRQCPNMKIYSQGTLITPRLHKLQITEVEEDEDFWEGSLNTTIQKMFKEMIGFRGVENLTLSEFPHLKEVWPNQFPVSLFSNLKSLVVVDNDCGSLKYIFIPSVALGLAQLQELEIKNCTILEAIMVIKKERIDNTLFPNLNRLELKDLPKLSGFCNFAGNSIKMPSLTQLWIENCPNMETFIFGSADADMPASKEILHTDIQPFFDEKVEFPSLEKMVISGMDNLKSIWHNQFIGDSLSFYKLKSVEVNDCQELKTILPSCICGRLLRLESLTVKSCGSVIEIFDLQGLNLEENHSIQTTQLRALYIDHLSNLKHIWNEDPKGMLSFEKLEKVTVFLCSNLENLFPASVAKSLLNLDSLEVSDCGVEEIIAKEGGVKEAAADRLLFPQLSSLQLHNLPRLRTFYPGHTVEGPWLKRLGLHHCDKVTLSISEFLGFYETIEEGQLDISIHEQPPFFLVQEIEGTNQRFPNLEELQLSGKAMAMRWPSQVLGHVFRSLKSLELNDHESTVVPLDFIQRFGNLEKLLLNSSSYNKEIFSYGKDKEHLEIKHLVLSGLFDLKQIWKQGSKIDPNFQNLQILEVRSCFNLINLMPSSASFRNLMILEVWGCDRLKNLLTSSTAKSMVLLEKLEVFDCKMLTEVVANEGAGREEIVFGKLKSLSLLYLQSLTSFCSAKHTLNFPILESLVVNECPEMKIFSKGVTSTSTPKLHKLELNWKEIEYSWKVGVNTTIQQNMEGDCLEDKIH